MPGSKSDFLELELLDHVLGGAAMAYTAPTNIHVALFTVAPTDSGGGTEVTGGSYARVQVTNNATNFPAASAGLKQNGTAITFAQATADWGTVVAFGLFDASTSGNLLYWGWLGTDDGDVFTATNAGDLFTVPGHSVALNDQVRLLDIPGSALPTGVTVGVTYFVLTVTGNTFQLSATQGGSAIVLTTDGSGLLAKITAKPVLNGDTASFAINALQIRED
jgi:hypothetical protein